MPSAPAIRLELRRSRLRRRCEWALIALAALALVLATWPLWLRLTALAVFAATAIVAMRSRTSSIRTIEWRSDGGWQLDDEPAQLRSSRVLGPLIALDFVAAGRRRSLMLWPDSGDADALRRLRIRLSRTTPADGDSPDGRAVG